MKLIDKAKAAAEQAAVKAKEGVEDVQTKRELSTALGELGTKTFELVDAGGLEHAELTPLVEKIRGLKAKLAAEDAEAPAAESEGEASSQPPAMPT
jgi:hypothetical protein